MRADNFGGMENCAFVTEIRCAWRADKFWLGKFELLAFAFGCGAETFWALGACRNDDFAEFAWYNDRLNFNIRHAILSLEFSLWAEFPGWLAGDTFACGLQDKLLDGSGAFLSTSLGWSHVAFAWGRTIEGFFANAAIAFLLEAVRANEPTNSTVEISAVIIEAQTMVFSSY